MGEAPPGSVMSTEAYASCLVIGADSTIGSALFQDLSAALPEVYGTTRRKIADTEGGMIGEFDLSVTPPFPVTCPVPKVIFICAAVTSFAACAADPLNTEIVNVNAARDIARYYMDRGSFVIFLSTSAVFDGSTKFPDEKSAPSPTTEYGRQKALAESLMLGMDPARSKVAIVRLTKVFTRENAVILDFIEKLGRAEICQPFIDLVISPISINYAIAGLREIASQKTGGIFHLSGAQDITYADLAKKIAFNMGVSLNLVRPVFSAQKSANLIYKPTFPSLGMTRTESVVGIGAESLTRLLENLRFNRTSLL